MRSVYVHLFRGSCVILLGLVLSGCANPKAAAARGRFYSGRLIEAEQQLAEIKYTEKDAILLFMERGTIRQSLQKYDESASDLLKAVQREDYLRTHSATETAASFLANDNTIAYRGPPFERTLLHTFLAKDFLARGRWEDAAVEARSIINNLQNLDGFPDDAYSRYMAGFCLELMRDRSNASLQYRNASNLTAGVHINESTGAIGPGVRESSNQGNDDNKTAELVCFVMIGRSPTGAQMHNGVPILTASPYAEFYSNGKYLGRSYPFSNVNTLLYKTMARKMAMQAAKDIARVAVKATIAHQLKQQDEGLGLLAELIMFALETPDERRWETLPMWLQVARMPCPPDLKYYEVVFKGPTGGGVQRMTITEPISRHDNLFVSICRNLPPSAPEQAPAALPKK